MMIKPLLLILSGALLLSCSKEVEEQTLLPNVVLIMADDLGYGDLPSYGNETIKTPNLDFLASEGVIFTDFHSNGTVCSPTRAALMTGRYQQRTGVAGVVTAKSHREVGLPLEELTLADELKKYGYHCGMFGKWHLGYAAEFNPTLQGFDEYTGFVSGNVDYHAHIDQEGFLDWWKGATIDNEAGYLTDLITEYSRTFIRENNPQKTHKPFFLYVPHGAPHSPYQRRIDAKLREVGTAGTQAVDPDSIPDIYREMVEVMDEGIGKIIGALRETGQYEHTIILFLSDNGANQLGSNGVLRGHKGGVYEGGSRVPAMMSFPNRIPKGGRNQQTVLTMDVLPTVLDFIDQQPTAKKVDGISIKDNLLTQVPLPERDVFFSYKNRSFVRSGKWKLVQIVQEETETLELYDLATDLSESKDLGAENLELVERLHAKLTHWQSEVREGVNMVSE